jgi:hypothetical protein
MTRRGWWRNAEIVGNEENCGRAGCVEGRKQEKVD